MNDSRWWARVGFADGERMALQHIGQQPHGLVAALRNVHPDEQVVLLRQRLDFGHIVRLDLVARKRQHPHPGHVLTLDPKEPRGTLPLSERQMKTALRDGANTLRGGY
jgi:hypothetical protein